MSPTKIRGSFFSRISAIAGTTFVELVRQKVFYFLLIFALLIIGNSAFMVKFSFLEEFQMLKDVSLGAMAIFTSLLAILGTAMLIPKDIEERTIYTILAKPIPRYEYLLGKLTGIFTLLLLSTILMSIMFLTVLWFREQSVIAETQAQLAGAPPEELKHALEGIRSATFNINLLPGIIIIFMKAALLAAMTLLISSFATSSIFGIITATAIYFIGHLQATARDFWLAGVDTQWWTRALTALLALLFPDLQAFSLADDVVAGTAIPAAVFWQTFVLGWIYIAVYYSLASYIFSGREL
ncbi:MAG: ABC transporter permease [Chthoniobacterales bacterium]